MTSGGSRVMIPADVKNSIQNIKDIIKNKHSDEDIYSVLIECSMDPDETIQKLLYLDSFQLVKRKSERKEVSNNRSYTDSRQGGGQGRGGRGWRGGNSSQDGGRGRNSAPRKENRGNRTSERDAVPAADQTQNKGKASVKKSLPVAVKDLSNVSNEVSTQGSNSHASAGVNTLVADSSPVNKLPNAPPQLSNDGKQQPDSKSKPTFASLVKAAPISNSKHKVVPSVGSVASSVSTPVVVPSLSSGTSDAITDNGCEVATQQSVAEPSLTAIAESNSTQTNPALETIEELIPITTASGTATSLDTVLADQCKEVTEDEEQLPTSNSDIQLSQQNSSEEVVISESTSVKDEATTQDAHEVNAEPESTEPHLSDAQHVIFPDHFRVPEEFKAGLTFGSFDVSPELTSTIVDDAICENTASEAVDSLQAIDESAEEPSLSNQSVSSTPPEVDYMDRPQSPDDIQENSVAPSGGADSITAAPKLDKPKQEALLPIGGPPFPVAQNVPNYHGFLPPIVGTQPIQFEKSDSPGHFPNFTNGNSLVQSTTPPPSQHVGVAQSSIPLPSQQVPMFRQAYPHNYLPYHYLSPYFMPPMLLGHGGFQQQPPSGYLPQSAASATAGKFPLPPYKPSASPGNQGHIGIPGPFPSSPAAYGLSVAVGSGGNNDNEVFAASHSKENNMYPSGHQQTEGSPVWMAAPGRETPGMLANSYYNRPPHGQHVAFSPTHSGQGAFAGLYHQSIAAPSTYHPLHQQSQNLPGSAEAVDHPPPPASYQGGQMNWNGTSY